MENTFIELLQEVSPQIATILVIIIGGGGICLAFYTLIVGIKKIIDAYNTYVIKKNEEREQFAALTESIGSLCTSIQTIQTIVEENHNTTEENIRIIKDTMNQCRDDIGYVSRRMNDLTQTVNIMERSEMEDVRSFITNEYFKWSEFGYIDVDALRTLEARYESYIEMHGDSFIADYMNSLRALPKRRYKPKNNHNENVDEEN